MTKTIDTILTAQKIVANATRYYRIMICEEMPAIYIKLEDDEKTEQIVNELGKEIECDIPWDFDKRYIEIYVPGGYEDIDCSNPKWSNVRETYFYSYDELCEILG